MLKKNIKILRFLINIGYKWFCYHLAPYPNLCWCNMTRKTCKFHYFIWNISYILSQTLCTEYIISKNIIIFYFLAKNLKILKTHQVTFKGCFRIYKQYKYTSFIYLWNNRDLVPQFMEANLLCIHIVYYYGAVDFSHSKHQADQGAFASPCTPHQSNLQHFSE